MMGKYNIPRVVESKFSMNLRTNQCLNSIHCSTYTKEFLLMGEDQVVEYKPYCARKALLFRIIHPADIMLTMNGK